MPAFFFFLPGLAAGDFAGARLGFRGLFLRRLLGGGRGGLGLRWLGLFLFRRGFFSAAFFAGFGLSPVKMLFQLSENFCVDPTRTMLMVIGVRAPGLKNRGLTWVNSRNDKAAA